MLEERAFAVFLMLIAIAAGYVGYWLGGVLPGVICLVLALAIAAALWTPLRGWLGIPPRKKAQSAEGAPRIGYRGGLESYGNLSKAKIKGQDTAIDNEGEVDAGEAEIE